jgi:tripartite-type tricarboxylate transporter receptor subunit TctC
LFVTVAADGPYKSIDDIVAAAKAEPGKATTGVVIGGPPWPQGN